MTEPVTGPMRCCPICSHPPHFEVPNWFPATRSSEKRSVRCHIIMGCSHAERLFKFEVVEEPLRTASEGRWNAHTEELFTNYTAAWKPHQAAGHRTRMGWPEKVPL